MTRGRFQLLLFIAAIVGYLLILGFPKNWIWSGGGEYVIFCGCITIFCLIFAGLLTLISGQRISYIGGLIVSLYLPLLYWGERRFANQFHSDDYQTGIKIFYEDERKGLAEKMEHFVIDNSLVKPPYRFHFMAVKQLCDDTSKYASYFFYTPQDSPEWKAFIIVSDLDGNTFVERSMTAADSFTSRLYHYKLTQYEYADDFIGGSNNAGTRPLSQNDSVFIDAFTHEVEDTVSMNDIVSAPYIP